MDTLLGGASAEPSGVSQEHARSGLVVFVTLKQSHFLVSSEGVATASQVSG
jgi:hypothetical protein